MLLNASGCLDALVAPEVARQLDGFVTKTITPLPREGNAPPRIAETAHGMLNAIGLANPGRERFLADTLPRLRDLGAAALDLRRRLLRRRLRRDVRRADDVEAIELNLSCPNVDEAADSAAEIVAACRAATPLPLYAKLSAAHPDVAEVARAVADAGADGLSLINTLRGLALDPHTLQARARARQRRSLGPVAQAGRAARGPRVLRSDAAADRRHGRRRDRAGRDRLRRVRRAARRARHGAVLRSGRAAAHSRRARTLSNWTTILAVGDSVAAKFARERRRLIARRHVGSIGRPAMPAAKTPTHAPVARSTSAWMRSSGRTTYGSGARS